MVDDAVLADSRSQTVISRDFCSVANNLGNSVAFNLESDKQSGSPLFILGLPVTQALNQEAPPKKYATAIFFPREPFLLDGRFANG